MDIQPILSTKGFQTVTTLLGERKRSDFLLFLVLFIGMFCLVPLMVMSGLALGLNLALGIVVVLIFVVLVVRWPIVGFFLVVGCTLVVDQSPLLVLNYNPKIYVFYWPTALEGLPDRPIGFFMLFVLLVLMVHNLLKRQKVLQGGALFWPYVCFLLCVAWGIVHGLSTGGNLKIIVNEVRSFWYLFLGYILAYNLIRSKKHLRTFFWFVIICAGIKAIEGVYIYAIVIHGDLADWHEIMAHEESYFWISVLLLIMLFSLHYKYRPQFYTALALVPFLLISLIANNRRADFVALLVGIMIVWLLIFVIKPKARRLLITIAVLTLLIGGVYVALFYKQQGGFSEPARAVVSVFYTNPSDLSDAASNLYRDIEDYDLKYTARLNPLGFGFGKAFLQPEPLPNISDTDPVYNYIPHNTIYWVLMRLGPIGYAVLWYLFGAIIVRGCLYARRLQDKYLQLTAIYIVAMVVMEIIVAYADYQLSFYRNVIYMGMLAGILMRLPAMDKEKDTLVA